MAGYYAFMRGEFVGPWTEEDAAAFVERVKEIIEEERVKKEPTDGEK